MALRCDYCNKGVSYGHAVSHAKNRTRRMFKPNLQKLKVLKNGITIRVKFCTRCIKRLKKDTRMGMYSVLSYAAVLPIPKVALPVLKQQEVKISRKAMKTSDIIGGSLTSGAPAKKENKEAEKIKLDAIVGKKG